MDAAMLRGMRFVRPLALSSGEGEGRVIDAAQFRRLLVSHRRMVRFDQAKNLLRGLRDLDSGEVFLTDAQRLLDARR